MQPMRRFSLEDVGSMVDGPVQQAPRRRFSLNDIESLTQQAPSQDGGGQALIPGGFDIGAGAQSPELVGADLNGDGRRDVGVPDRLDPPGRTTHTNPDAMGPAAFAERMLLKPGRDVATGYRAGASDLYRAGANALNLVNRGGDYLTDKTGIGIPSTSPESGFGTAERWMRETSRKVAPTQEQLPTDTIGKIYSGLGRAPVDLAQYATGARLLGPVAGMAGVEALREADQGPVAAAQAGAKGALLGGVLKATEPLTLPGKIGTLGGVGAGQAAIEGGDASDIVASGTVMGTLGAMGRGGDTRLRDIPRNARMSLAELQERLRASSEASPDRVEPTIEPSRPAEPITPPTIPRPEAPPAPSVGVPGNDVVVTPRGRRVEVKPEIVEARDLVASQTDAMTPNPAYPQALQPRDRSRVASLAQVNEIASNLQPELLGRSASAGEGAPIIGPDGVIESGNGRVLALRRAYGAALPGAESYRAWLESQGYDLAGFKEPVLIRRRVTQLDDPNRIAFAAEANERTSLGMSVSEQGRADARNITPQVLDLYQGGDIGAGINSRFVRSLAEKIIPTNERGTALTASGELSQAGMQRVRAALFNRAFDDIELLAKLRESPDNEIKAIGEAMTDAAPVLARLRGQIEAGNVPKDLDATGAIRDAARLVQRARETNVPVGGLIRQGDMFRGGTSPDTLAALRLFFRDDAFKKPRARAQVAEALRFYADQAGRSQAGEGLFPGSQRSTAADILKLARDRVEGGLLSEAAEMRVPEAQSSGTGILSSATNKQAGLLGGQKPQERAAGLLGNLGRVDLPEIAKVEAQNSTPQVMEMTPGANYVGMRPQIHDPSVSRRSGEPLRREAILGPLFEAFGVPLYEGRIKSNKTLGFFRKSVEEVRIKNPGDIEVAAHEMAHLLDSRVPEIREQWRRASSANKAVRQELAGVSYDKSKLYEGFAEFVRLWATQKSEARVKAPQFYGWFEDFVARSEYGPALRRSQTEMHDWFAQHALDRARSKIGVATTVNSFLNRSLDRFRQSVFDDLHGIMQAEKHIDGKIGFGGAYETARLLRGKMAFFEGALRIGAPKVNADGSHSYTGKGLEQILKPVSAELDDFLLYAVGRSARETMSQRREHLFTSAEIDAMVKLERPSFREAFSEYQVWNNKILDFAEAKGVIDPNVRQMWRRADYLPFHRVGQPGAKQTVPGDWKGIKALTGGTENLRDVLGNMIGNAKMLLDASLANEVRVKIADLAKKNGGAALMAEIPKEDRIVKVHHAEVERAILDALGVGSKTGLPVEQQVFLDQIIQNMRPMAEFMLRGQAPLGHNIVAVLRRGKPEYYEVADPILFRSLESLNRAPQDWVMQLLSMPRRVGQASVTVAFDFIAANIARDTLMGGIMSRNGFRPFVDSAIGIKSRLTKDETYKEYIANGGGFASYFKDENHFKSHLKRFYSNQAIDYRTVLDAPGKLLNGLETIVESFEVATRLGEYRRARQRGEHPRHAAYEAREVSTDFGMRGDSKTLGFFYDTVLFLKAASNGMDRVYRGVAHDSNKASIAAKTGLLALASMGLYAANRDNPLYDQIEDWDKDAHWHFFVPTPAYLKAKAADSDIPLKDRYTHLRYPKIWEIGAVASLSERSLKGALDGMTVDDAKKMLATIANMMNFDYVPQAVAPLYEQTLNKDRFTGRPIESGAMQELQPWARATAYTPTILRKAGEGTMDLPRPMQIPPARFEHLLKGYFNTWASYGLTLADGAIYDKAPDLRADQYPVLRRFYRQEPAQHTRFETELHEMIREATEARRTMSLMDRRWRPDIAAKLENAEENQLYGQAQHIAQHMRVFRKEAEQVVTAETLNQVRALVEQRVKQPGNSGRARMAEDWGDMGALKRWLLDSLVEEKNEFTELAYRDIKKRRDELKAGAR